MSDATVLRRRRIRLSTPPSAAQQAASRTSLGRLDGITEQIFDGDRLIVTYDLDAVGFEAIERTLRDANLALSCTPGQRLARGFYAYCDANFREARGEENPNWANSVETIYSDRFRHRRHGRRDDRPLHWRQYLARKKP